MISALGDAKTQQGLVDLKPLKGFVPSLALGLLPMLIHTSV